MAIRYKNPQTGEYEVIKIPVMKGEQGHAGIHVGTDAPPTTDVKLWFDPSDTDNDVDLANRLDTTLTACYDYMGNDRGSIKAAADANVDWLLGEINTVHHDGQHITATDTIEGRSKSAILKGQTLVNVINYNDTVITTANKYVQFSSMIKEIVATTITIVNDNNKPVRIQTEVNGAYNRQIVIKANSKQAVVLNADEKLTRIRGSQTDGWAIDETGLNELKRTVMILEGDHTQEDIPYFTGMQSVNMPVLTTTGKNLFDGEFDLKISNTHAWSKNFIKVLPNTDYIFSHHGTDSGKKADRTEYYNEKFELIGYQGISNSVTTPNDCHYIKFRYHLMDQDLSKVENTQLEQGTVATAYEPYKTNILSCNEEVELRGIGDVRDELNVVNGELTQRIKEVVFDGSENWDRSADFSSLTNTVHFQIQSDTVGIEFGSPLISDKFINCGVWAKDMEGINCATNGNLAISINRDRLSGLEVADFKKWLSQNNVTVVGKSTESIKTVDLSDNHVYSYKGTTHYDCSSAEGSLVPTLSIDVPTNLSALVTKQRQQIRTLEEENKELNQELQLAITSSEESDNELLAQSFELDFRLMEVEFALDLPMAATFRLGGKAMAMTPYEMAKKLILADNYDRADMEHKLDVYVSKKRMTEAERQELIQLMDEKEGIITTDPIEPEVEESITEHEAVTIPLH